MYPLYLIQCLQLNLNYLINRVNHTYNYNFGKPDKKAHIF